MELEETWRKEKKELRKTRGEGRKEGRRKYVKQKRKKEEVII